MSLTEGRGQTGQKHVRRCQRGALRPAGRETSRLLERPRPAPAEPAENTGPETQPRRPVGSEEEEGAGAWSPRTRRRTQTRVLPSHPPPSVAGPQGRRARDGDGGREPGFQCRMKSFSRHNVTIKTATSGSRENERTILGKAGAERLRGKANTGGRRDADTLRTPP